MKLFSVTRAFLAVTVYRIAHHLYRQNIPLMRAFISEYVHALTGIDIHVRRNIGASFFHRSRSRCGYWRYSGYRNRVRIYQGVTLGALAIPKEDVERLRTKKRHPTIEDDVIIYAGATILGGRNSNRRRIGHRRQCLVDRIRSPRYQGLYQETGTHPERQFPLSI